MTYLRARDNRAEKEDLMIATNTFSRSACLALGGGGARGLAHLGVVEVLKQSHISVERYVGVSIGGLAGAMCAIDGDIASVQKKAVDYLTSKAFQSKQVELFNAAPPADEPAASGLFAWYNQLRRYMGAKQKLTRLLSRPALLEPGVMQNIVNTLLPDIDIRDTATPLSIVALDLLSGKEVVLTEGSLRDAVMASAAIPGVFPSVKWKDMQLCDVGMMDAIPARVAKSCGADLTIAVDVSARVEPIKSCETAAEVFLRLYNIGETLVRTYTAGIADLLICSDVSHNPWYDFSDPQSLIDLGRHAAETCLRLGPPHLRIDESESFRSDQVADVPAGRNVGIVE